MSVKPIQELFGQQVIESFAAFAREDLRSVADLESGEFSHVRDRFLRRRLASVFYGARWIYKLGLALLVTDVERAAHVRSQVVDYASVVEGLIAHCLAHAIRNGHVQGTAYQWRNPAKQRDPIAWDVKNPEQTLNGVSFWWLIHVARDFRILTPTLERDLHWLRKQRNTVHIRQNSGLGEAAFLKQSKRAFEIVMQTISKTQTWKNAHP